MMDHIDKLALQQQHDDHIAQAELTKKLITVMEFLNNKDIAINLPENLRIKHDGVQEVEGSVKAIVANAISVENLDELAKHLELIAAEIQKTNELAGETNKRIADGLVVPPSMVMLYDQFLEAIAILRDLGKKDFGVVKAKDTVVVFPKKPNEAIPVVLTDKTGRNFYDAIFNGTFSAPDNVRINNDSGNPVPVEIIGSGPGGGGATSIADGDDATQGAKADSAATTDTGSFSLIALIKRGLQKLTGIATSITDGSLRGTVSVDNLPATQVVDTGLVQPLTDAELRATPVPVAIDAGSLATEQTADDQVDILNEIQAAVEAIASTRGVTADLRVTVVGGTVAVSTVTTLTNMAQVGGQLANNLVPAQSNVAAVQSNIINVIVS